MQKEFYEAAVFPDMEKIKSMVSTSPEIVTSSDESGFTALHFIAGEEHAEVAIFLIANGADVNAKNDEGITPLHLAAWPHMAELLVSQGADLNIRDKAGRTPLIVHAAESDDCDVMEALLRIGADPDASDIDGNTALTIAIQREETDKIELLNSYARK